jgi:four helix bundle protein
MNRNPRVPARSYRELLVWQKAIQLSAAIYRLSESFPRREMYGLTAQMRRSAISVPSNIAEGQGRLTTGEFRQFLGIARGSNSEIQTQLEIARVLNIGDEKMLATAEALSHDVGKLIYFLLESLKDR